MINIQHDFNYYRSGVFMDIPKSYFSECKELFGEYILGRNFEFAPCDFHFYYPQCEEKFACIQGYFELLGFDKELVLERATDVRKEVSIIKVCNLLNIIEVEIAAILIKAICSSKTISALPVSLDSLTGKYFTVHVKNILRDVPGFLDGLTDNMLSRCEYDFNSDCGHGGLINWAAKGIFKNKLTKRRLWRNILYGI